MSNSNGIIQAPVDLVNDVYRVLGIGPQNGGYSVGYACSNTHGKINMWSRMKPVHLNKLFHERTGNWWKGADYNCGLTPKGVPDYRNIPAAFTSDGMNGWTYSPPAGGASSPYRQEDFDNYFHGATPPMFNFTANEKVAMGKTLWVSCMLTAQPDSGSSKDSYGSIAFEDIQGVAVEDGITSLGDYYFGIVITDSTGKVVDRVAGPNRASSGLVGYTVKAPLKLNQTYTAYPYLSLRENPQGETDNISQCYTIPNVKPASFKVVSLEESAGLVIFFTAVRQSDTFDSFITWDIKITAEQNISVLASHIECRYTTGSLNVNEYSKNLGSFSISPGTPYTNSGKFSSLDSSKQYHLNIYLRTNIGTFERNGVLPIESAPDPDQPVKPWEPPLDTPIN